MSEKAKHLITFQNLCVIAHLDGILHPEERAMLLETAKSMGLSEADIAPLMNQGPRLDFIIPATEGECFIELRMVVLMMLSDGRMDEREYQGCKRLADRMGIEQGYLDETIAFYTEKQLERQQHLAIFQNLYLVAAADGYIDPQEQQLLLEVARTLGLSQSDVDQVLESKEPLSFIIPEGEEDQYFSLKNLVYMMVVDGTIAPEEYELCVEFARKIGRDAAEVDAIVEEYEKLRDERQREEEDVLQVNTDEYLDLFNDFNQIGREIEEWLHYLQRAEQTGRCETPPGLNEEERAAFIRLMWLIYVRSYQLSDEAEMMVPLYLDLARAKGNLQDLFNYLINHERTHGAEPVDVAALPIADLEAELKEQLGKLI